VVIESNGPLDSERGREVVLRYLNAVHEDCALPIYGTVCISDTTIGELDRLLDSLYLFHDVGYVVLASNTVRIDRGNLNPYRLAWSADLTLVGKDSLIEGIISYTELRCREIAMSWIPAPYTYSFQERQEYFVKVFETYAAYHENQDDILNEFPYRNLHINWDDNHGYGTLGRASEGYELDSVVVLNSDSAGVAVELVKKAYLWTYYLHGGANENSFGYNPLGQIGKKDALWTTPEEFDIYVQKYGAPALLVHPLAACQYAIVDTGGPGKCCWPQRMLEAGVWAYYGLHGNGNLTRVMEKAFMEAPFIGHAIRRLPVGEVFIAGDITARFRKSPPSVKRLKSVKETDGRMGVRIENRQTSVFSIHGIEGHGLTVRRMVDLRGNIMNFRFERKSGTTVLIHTDASTAGMYIAEIEIDGVRSVELLRKVR